jgi:hypothetical protein
MPGSEPIEGPMRYHSCAVRRLLVERRRTMFRVVSPVRFWVSRATASAVNTTVRWASIAERNGLRRPWETFSE